MVGPNAPLSPLKSAILNLKRGVAHLKSGHFAPPNLPLGTYLAIEVRIMSAVDAIFSHIKRLNEQPKSLPSSAPQSTGEYYGSRLYQVLEGLYRELDGAPEAADIRAIDEAGHLKGLQAASRMAAEAAPRILPLLDEPWLTGAALHVAANAAFRVDSGAFD